MSNILDELAGANVDLDQLKLGDLGVDITSFGWQLSEDGEAQEIVREADRYSMNQEEREWMLTVLDSCRRIHATAIVRVYTCKKDASTWDYIGLFGVAALVTEADLRMACAHFIRIIDLDGFNPNSSVMLQQELYPNFEYNVQNEFFHTFEMTKYIAGLSFANEDHAKAFYEKVQEVIKLKAADVVDEDLDSKEKTYRMVGDTDWRNAGDISVSVARKYAGGGITDGTEVSWKKKADLPPELAALLSEHGALKPDNKTPNTPPTPKSTSNNSVIDLLDSNRRATVDMSRSNSGLGDGINHSWSKNKKALTDDVRKSTQPMISPPPTKKKRFKVFGKKK